MENFKGFTKKHPSIWRYISILAIITLVVPTLILGNFAGDGGKYFALSAYLLIAILGAYEVLKNLNVHKVTAFATSLTVALIFFFPTETFDLSIILEFSNIPSLINFGIHWQPILIIGLAPLLLLIDPKFGYNKRSMMQLIIASFSMIIISIFAKFIWLVNVLDYIKLFYYLPIAIIADSFGYFGGKYLRKYILNGKKLAPSLSPKKTWAGFIIGYIFSALFIGVAGWELNIFDSLPNSIPILITLTILLPIVSPIGDLLFSGIKRYLGIKDFSNLMPGHGGIMDRIDAMSTVILFIFIVFAIVL